MNQIKKLHSSFSAKITKNVKSQELLDENLREWLKIELNENERRERREKRLSLLENARK
jgi:hypothetical protein